jgi:predicted nucleic acid-binding protein
LKIIVDTSIWSLALRRRAVVGDGFVSALRDYERAAEFFNVCRKRGIQGSTTDFLICAAAVEREQAIFTADEDFKKFQRAIPVALFKPYGYCGRA